MKDMAMADDLLEANDEDMIFGDATRMIIGMRAKGSMIAIITLR